MPTSTTTYPMDNSKTPPISSTKRRSKSTSLPRSSSLSSSSSSGREERSKSMDERNAPQPEEDSSSATMLLALQSASPRSPTSTSASTSASPSSSSPLSPASPASTELNTSVGEDGVDTKCMLNDCALCARGVPMLLVRSPTWASIMRVVFYCLQYDKKDRLFFNLKTDIYGFIISHWNKLSLNKKRSDNWHKQIQDMLSHSKNLFESGMEKYKQNGFWRMKQNHDPWTMHRPRSYNWSKRANRNAEGADSEFITVFDVATGVVVQEGDIESPRKKIKGDDDSGDEVTTKQSLEDEIKSLKEALAEMSENLHTVKEELKKKDQEILEKAFTYQRTLEQLEALKLAHSQTEPMQQDREPPVPIPSSIPPQWSESFNSPRTSSPYRFPSTPPLSRHLEPTHFPSPPPVHHLGPNFPPSRALFPPFELPVGVSTGRRFSPPSLPFPPSLTLTADSTPPMYNFTSSLTGSPTPFPHHPHPQAASFPGTSTSTTSSSQQPFPPSMNPSQFEFKPVSNNRLLSLSAPLPPSSYSVTPDHFSPLSSPLTSPHRQHTPRGPPPS